MSHTSKSLALQVNYFNVKSNSGAIRCESITQSKESKLIFHRCKDIQQENTVITKEIFSRFKINSLELVY